MKTACQLVPEPRLTLEAETAAELMSENPVSLRLDASVQEAIALMTDRNFDAAPVIDTNGRPVGVVTVSDILIHDREYARYLKTGDVTARCDVRRHANHLPGNLGIEVVDRATVQQIMTPNVYTVNRQTPAAEVVRKMLDFKVHHLFVVDDQGTVIGVISSCDILRRLA